MTWAVDHLTIPSAVCSITHFYVDYCSERSRDDMVSVEDLEGCDEEAETISGSCRAGSGYSDKGSMLVSLSSTTN